MQNITVGVVQGATRWHDAEANRRYYGDLVRSIAQDCDLIVLPETFTSGFTNETQYAADTMTGESLRWLSALATEVGSVITGAALIDYHGLCEPGGNCRVVPLRGGGSQPGHGRHRYLQPGCSRSAGEQ